MLKRGAPKISSWGGSHNPGVLREGGGSSMVCFVVGAIRSRAHFFLSGATI